LQALLTGLASRADITLRPGRAVNTLQPLSTRPAGRTDVALHTLKPPFTGGARSARKTGLALQTLVAGRTSRAGRPLSAIGAGRTGDSSHTLQPLQAGRADEPARSGRARLAGRPLGTARTSSIAAALPALENTDRSVSRDAAREGGRLAGW
jgi:hypothetical protein